MADGTQPAEILKNQFALEKELRERTTKELESHDHKITELFNSRNEHAVKLDRLEQSEKARKWFIRVIVAAVVALIVKAAWPLAVAVFKVLATGA